VRVTLYRYLPVWRREGDRLALYRCFEIPGQGFVVQSKDFYAPRDPGARAEELERSFVELLIESAPEVRAAPQATLEAAIASHDACFEWAGEVVAGVREDRAIAQAAGGAIESNLRALGLALPAAKAPVANYVGTRRAGKLLFVSGRVSALRGVVGADVSLDAARQAACDTALDLLAIVKDGIGGDLDDVRSIVMVRGFVRSAPDFGEQPRVIDGASDLLVALWGNVGEHARTATGVNALPFGACVQLDLILGMA
jgi:enamine deaminase RidA (YjgF/YER057c/UK114 family)